MTATRLRTFLSYYFVGFMMKIDGSKSSFAFALNTRHHYRSRTAQICFSREFNHEHRATSPGTGPSPDDGRIAVRRAARFGR
jgi:hypothetical protein